MKTDQNIIARIQLEYYFEEIVAEDVYDGFLGKVDQYIDWSTKKYVADRIRHKIQENSIDYIGMSDTISHETCKRLRHSIFAPINWLRKDRQNYYREKTDE